MEKGKNRGKIEKLGTAHPFTYFFPECENCKIGENWGQFTY